MFAIFQPNREESFKPTPLGSRGMNWAGDIRAPGRAWELPGAIRVFSASPCGTRAHVALARPQGRITHLEDTERRHRGRQMASDAPSEVAVFLQVDPSAEMKRWSEMRKEGQTQTGSTRKKAAGWGRPEVAGKGPALQGCLSWVSGMGSGRSQEVQPATSETQAPSLLPAMP